MQFKTTIELIENMIPQVGIFQVFN